MLFGKLSTQLIDGSSCTSTRRLVKRKGIVSDWVFAFLFGIRCASKKVAMVDLFCTDAVVSYGRKGNVDFLRYHVIRKFHVGNGVIYSRANITGPRLVWRERQ